MHRHLLAKAMFGQLAFSVLASVPSLVRAAPEPRQVDYRFQPPLWHTPVGLPGDWHKPLVDESGALVYDFGPGPYARPNTRVGFSLANSDATVVSQTIDDPRVPIVITKRAGEHGILTSESFALLPEKGWETDGDSYQGDVRRLNGLNSCLGWASPPGSVDPAFRNVAFATNRPLIYRVRTEAGASRRVVLGFADPYRERGHRVKRIMAIKIEGAAEKEVDVVDRVGKNAPLVLSFEARDTDGDGWLEIAVRAARHTVDANLFLNVLWVFETGQELNDARLIRGELSAKAEHYIDCGRDPELLVRAGRREAIVAELEAAKETQLVVDILTKRELSFDENTGALLHYGVPFVQSSPKAEGAERTERGWRLLLPKGTRQAVAMVNHAGRASGALEVPDLGRERQQLAHYWRDESGLPWTTITVSDPGIQSLFEGCIRTMYQLTERVDGSLQSQPGPSVYRGLWVSNQPRVCRALAHLGDFSTARASLAQTWRFQEVDGRIVVLTPPILLKETGTAMHAIYQHARLSRDPAYLASYWPALQRAGNWIARVRDQVTDPEALNFGLLPAGMSDGGVGGIIPEYTSVYWNLLGAKNLVDAAAWLGKFDEAARYEVEYTDFATAFRRAAARDLRQDRPGNWYLPIPMAFNPATQQAQRSMTQFSYMVYPGRLFAKRDPLVLGNMAMLADVPRAEGLLMDTGWLDGGLQPFIESIRAGTRLYLGDVEQAQDTLYAVANHAAPTHVWIEEQLPGKGPRKATGDVPHSSAASELINLVRYFVAMEDGDRLDLLKGVPAEWIYPGARIATRAAPTEFGLLTLDLTVTEDGREAALRVAPLDGPMGIEAGSGGGPRVHLQVFKAMGFQQPDGSPLPDIWGGDWGRSLSIRMARGQ